MTEQEIAAALVGRRLRWGDDWGRFTDEIADVMVHGNNVLLNTTKGDYLVLPMQRVEELITKGKCSEGETTYKLSKC